MEKENTEKKKIETIEDYIEELAEDVKLNEYNLREKALLCSSIWAKWLSRLFAERKTLTRINTLKSEIVKKNLSSKTQTSILPVKNIDNITENDDNMKKLKVLADQTQEKIDFCERSLQILQNFGYNIKNVTEVLKLQLQ